MIRFVAKTLGSLLVRLQSRVILSVWDEPQARHGLGRVYELMRQCDHFNKVQQVQSRYFIHPNAILKLGAILAGDGQIYIGDGSYIGEDSDIVAHPRVAQIHIGKGCAFARNVHVRTESYRTDISFEEARKSEGVWANIAIGDFVWIGANVFVCGGVTIGNNSVIGANSVVTRDVAPNSICGGVPSKFIKQKPSCSR
jgi:maltose O-acetyltransferase